LRKYSAVYQTQNGECKIQINPFKPASGRDETLAADLFLQFSLKKSNYEKSFFLKNPFLKNPFLKNTCLKNPILTNPILTNQLQKIQV